MVHDFVTAMPGVAGSRTLTIALIVAGLGLFFWIVGSRFSRSTFALAGVAIGTLVGLRIPRWFGWEIDAMAFAIGGALVAGLAGYLFHTKWVGTTLGVLLAVCGAFVAMYRVGDGGAAMPWGIFSASPGELHELIWANWLAKLPKAIPIAASLCMTSGGLIGWMWPKVSRVLTFSMLGTFMLAGGGMVAMAIAKPGWLERLPQTPQGMGIGLAILIVVGSSIQWMLLPRASRASVRVPDDVKSDDADDRKRAPVRLTRKEARA